MLHGFPVASHAWARRAVMLALVLLLLHAVAAWAYAAIGVPAAIVSALLVGASSLLSARLAGRGSRAWFVLPALAFTLVPLAGRVWAQVALGEGVWAGILALAPFVAGFAAPVLLLLAVYLELGRGARGRVADASASPVLP